MPISTDQIKQFEEWIAKGKTKDVVKNLLLIRDKTRYQSEIILLANKLKKLDEQEMANAISFSDHAVEQGKLNSSMLLLLAYLKSESQGGKDAIPGLSDQKGKAALSSKDQLKLWLHKYLPMIIACLLTTIIVGVIAYQMHENAYIKNCNNGGNNTNGEWNVKWVSGEESLFGKARIKQDACYKDFVVSCEFEVVGGNENLFTFNSKIGGYHDDQIYFVYENSVGEKGVCHGELIDKTLSSFYVKCIDLAVGADTSNGSTGLMYFSSKEIKK